MRARAEGSAAVVATVVLFLSACGSSDNATSTPGSILATPETVGKPDLDGIPAVSVPLVLSEYLGSVQLAVRQDVGDDIFGGAALTDADTEDITITIFGTDAERINDAVERIANDARDRIIVSESEYSVRDLERFADEAQRRLDAEGIDAYVEVRWGLAGAYVNLVTPDGKRDAAIESSATAALDGVPVGRWSAVGDSVKRIADLSSPVAAELAESRREH
jgi:hypothetical protein